MTAATLKLLPCPHCGAEADAPWREFGGYQYVVMCSDRNGCGAVSGLHKDRAAAISAWNRRQSLSQEAVRDEVLEAVCLNIQRAVSDYTRRTPPHLRDCDVLTGHIVRALKREPNAAAESYESAHPKALDEPAPAAPDVESMVRRINAQFDECCTFGGHWDRMRDVALEAAALSQLGQGWVSVSERLPKSRFGDAAGEQELTSDDVVVLLASDERCVANCTHGNWYDPISNRHLFSDSVTHWMPLPPPPERP